MMFDFYKNALSGAITTPLCADYINEWRNCGDDKGRLMQLALRQQSLPYFISHCHSGKGLSKNYILENFGEYINQGEKSIIQDADGVQGYTSAMYVAFNTIFNATTDVLALMWCYCAHVIIDATKSPILYVGANSSIHISCDGYNCPKIYLFDTSKIVLYDVDEGSKVVVYKYSDDAVVEKGKFCLGEVKEFRKELRL